MLGLGFLVDPRSIVNCTLRGCREGVWGGVVCAFLICPHWTRETIIVENIVLIKTMTVSIYSLERKHLLPVRILPGARKGPQNRELEDHLVKGQLRK